MGRSLLVLLGAMLAAIASSLASAEDAGALARRIDELIDARLKAEGIKPAALADDAEFLRRATLDLHGIVPPAEEAARFLDDDDPAKRAKLIDELLASPRFGEHQGNLWRARLISPLANEQRQQTERFAGWLADRFNRDPWDKIAFDLITATGKMEENPAVTYLIEGRNPLGVTDLTDLSSRYFLGVRLNCAQCHDHPFVDWKQSDYWGMAAFFAQIQTPGRPKQVYVAGVVDNPKLTIATLKDAEILEGYRALPPTFLGGQPLADGKAPYRVAFARWATSAENPYFARAAANRLWWQFFGRGLVNPVDDMHSENAPSHPELLELLSRELVRSGFDLKFLSRAILRSEAYQRTSRPGERPDDEAKFFARMSAKVLAAEQLYDSLVAILGPPGKTAAIDARYGARQEFSQFFAADGDPDPLRYDRGIPHALRLMNSPQFAGRNLAALAERVAKNDRDQAVETLFLTILARRPTAAEWQLAGDELARAQSRQSAYRDLAWALLMSSEFSLNR